MDEKEKQVGDKTIDKTSRPSFDEYMFLICHAVASRSTCRHRDQGAVIVRDKRIISTGYNGAPPGIQDCLERGYCSKDSYLPCMAEGLHGESNAIITAAKEGISVKLSTLYCVYSPCRACCNMIRTVGIKEVVYEHIYDGFPSGPEYLWSLGIPTRIIAWPSKT
jgi:dCMP deaminase